MNVGARYIDRAADVARLPLVAGDPGAHVREAMVDAFADGRAGLLRWEQSANNPLAYTLFLGTGPNRITVGRMISGYDRTLGHSILVSVGTWSELAQWNRNEAAAYLCKHLGIDPPVLP